jgi:tRNA-2-methylthio-N6-dimethylallyladenosine synthase
VPYTRGVEISRPLDGVLAEIVSLAKQGVKEITLLGQNVNDYHGLTYEGSLADLAALIEYIAAIDEIKRIRFTTSHPVAFSNRLIEAYAKVPQLANHLHLPVQSGSDRILAAMKRGYTVLEYKAKIRKLRKVRPDISLSSDFIVGFPGESDQDFEETMNLIHEVGFDLSYSFIYSPRPGTPASQLPDDISMDTKKRRLSILQDRIKQNAYRISKSMVGSIQSVLVDRVSSRKMGQLSGKTDNNRFVTFQGDPELIGHLAHIKVIEAQTYTLTGEQV